MDNYQELVDFIDEKSLKSFLKKTNSNFEIMTNTEKVEVDYSWIEKFEKYLPYLELIVKNPRQFIIHEEEVTIVEKTKRVNRDTIKHLAQHSNLIQDIEEDGSVSPSKLLNTYKEDTYDIYENRFIKTLMTRLVDFLDSQIKYNANKDSHITKKRCVTFQADTLQISENVKLNLSLETVSVKPINIDDEQYKKRMFNINAQIEEFMVTPFIKSLSMASPVKSPINRTNLILGDPNFRMCLELWEFLDKYENDKIIKITSATEIDKSVLKKELYLASYFLNYQTIDYNQENKSKVSRYETHLKKSIEECLEDLDMSDKDYCRLVDTKLKEIRRDQIKRKNEIREYYQEFITTNETIFKDAMALLNIL